MSLIGGQDTGLGNVDTAGQAAGDGAGSITEITSPDGSVSIANPTGPVVQLEVPAAKVPGSAISGLAFPLVAGTPTLTASEPVTLDVGLEVEGSGLEVVAGDFVVDAGVPATLHDTLEVDGISTFNGTVALNNGGTIEGQPIAAQIVAGTVNLASTPLSGISATGLTLGTVAWVKSVGRAFVLQTSALTVDHITVETASGLAGAQWCSVNATTSPTWAARAVWWVDPQNVAASDENDGGSAGAPLSTYAELARRLFQALLPGSVLVNVVSNAIAGDNAYFTIREIAGRLTFASTTLASGTPLFTGVVTTYVAQSTSLAADDNELTDALIPVSYTASGLLANGVIFKRTSGTAAYWYGAADLGSKTLRMSVPVNVGGTAILALAPGDTYAAYALPTIGSLFFSRVAAIRGIAFTELAILPATGATYQEFALWTRCFVSGITGQFWEGYSLFNNCAFDSGAGTTQASFAGGGLGSLQIIWGMFRSSSANALVQVTGTAVNFSGGTTFQGCWLQNNSGQLLSIAGRLSFYDTTSASVLSADYWAAILFFTSGSLGTGGVAGKNNSGKLLAVANWSNMAYVGAVPTVAGTSSDPNPILVGGVSSPVSALPINKTLANDIGIFATSERTHPMPDEQKPTSPLGVSLEDLASRLTALEVASTGHTAFLREFETDVGQTFQQIKAMLTANARAAGVAQAVTLPPTGAPAPAMPKRDAWGKPLDGSGKVVALPPARPPAPAPVAGQSAACSCTDHEPDHQKQGCAVKGCSCSETG